MKHYGKFILKIIDIENEWLKKGGDYNQRVLDVLAKQFKVYTRLDLVVFKFFKKTLHVFVIAL